MFTALIGSTGFVGTNLLSQANFDRTYNSQNIANSHNEEFDIVVCAAPSAVKWQANQFPEEDLKMVETLISHLKRLKTKQFVQISTVDVYPNPFGVDEDSAINPDQSQAYGKHRYFLESFVRDFFPKSLIVRLPALFGLGLKKNFIFDLIHQQCLDLTHKDSVFQFYHLGKLWTDIQLALEHNLKLLNIASEPIRAQDLAKEAFAIDFSNQTEKPPVVYDMRTKHAKLYGGSNGYIYSKEAVYKELKAYLASLKLS